MYVEMDVPTKKPPQRKTQTKRQRRRRRKSKYCLKIISKLDTAQKEIKKAIGKSRSNNGVIHKRTLEIIKKKESRC